VSERIDYSGHVCVLLEEPDAAAPRPPWQQALQQRFGGLCTTPVHVTLQRIPRTKAGPAQDIIGLVRAVTARAQPLWITGHRLEFRYSPFREGWIAKLHVDGSPELVGVRRALETALESVGAAGAIPQVRDGQRIPVTVLEHLPPECGEAAGDRTAPVEPPARLCLTTVTVSRIRAAFDYEILERWRLGE
jgi:hypothetical protein